MSVDRDEDRESRPFAGLFCPDCDYDLTGQEERRCPECGGVFDPELLRVLLDGSVRHAEPFSTARRQRGVYVAWWRTIVAVLFTPVLFARLFPRNCALTEPILFFLISVGFSILGPALAYLLGADAPIPTVLSSTVAIAVLPSAAILALFCQVGCRTRKSNPVDGWHTWFGLILFSTCHVLFLAIIGSLAFTWAELFTRGDDATLETAFAVGLVVIVTTAVVIVAWWIHMSLLIGSRSIGKGRIAVLLIGIPFSAVVGILGTVLCMRLMFMAWGAF